MNSQPLDLSGTPLTSTFLALIYVAGTYHGSQDVILTIDSIMSRGGISFSQLQEHVSVGITVSICSIFGIFNFWESR